MATPTIREVPTLVQATNAAVTVNLSSAVQAGDTIIVFHGTGVNVTYANLDRDPTTGTWTAFGTHTFQLGADSPQVKGAYATLAAGGAQSFTFAAESTALHNFGCIVLAGTATLDTVVIGDGFVEGVHAAPSASPASATGLGIAVVQSRSGTSADYSVQGDWTMRSECTGTAPMAIATKVLSAAGATGTITFTQSGSTWDEFKAVTSVWVAPYTWGNDFDAGTPSTTITVANSADSGNAAQEINSTPSYDATTSISGTQSMLSQLAANGTTDFRWTTFGSPNAFWVSDYFQIGALPAVVSRLFQVMSGATARWGVGVDTTGRIGVRNLNSGAFATNGLSTATLTTGTWHRYTLYATFNGTDWTVVLRLYLGNNRHGATADETLTTTGGLTLGSADTYTFGAFSSAASTWSGIRHDVIRLSDSGPIEPTPPALTNNAEGIADEAAVTTGNSATGGKAFDSVSGTVIADTAQAAHGGGSYRISTTASATASVNWTTALQGTHPTVYGRMYIRVTDFTVVSLIFMRMRSATVQIARVTADVTGHIQIRNGANTIIATAAGACSTNTWYRLEFQITRGATAISQVSIFLGDSTTAIETIGTGIAANYGTGLIDEVNYGIASASASVPTYWIDDLQANMTGFPGPATSSSAEFEADVAESVGLADSAGRAWTGSRPVAEAVAAADAVTRTVHTSRAVAEGLTAADSVTGTVHRPRAVAEGLTAADGVTGPVNRSRAVAEGLTAADAAVGVPTYSVHAADSVTVVDSVSRQLAVALAPAESIAFGDFAVRVNAQVSTTIADAVGADESISRTVAAGRATADSVEVTDSGLGQRNEGRLVAEEMTASDSVAWLRALFRAPVELIQVAGSGIANRDFTAAAAESFIMGDVADRAVSYVGQVVHDTVTLTDNATAVQHAPPIRAVRSHVIDTTRTAIIVDTTEVAA